MSTRVLHGAIEGQHSLLAAECVGRLHKIEGQVRGLQRVLGV